MPESVHDALDRLEAPPESPAFFDELWKQAELRERAAARRWRRISAVLAVVVIGAATAAAVFAFGRDSSVLDRTLQCVVEPHGGLPYVGLIADPTITGTSPGTSFPAGASVTTGENTQLLAFDTAHRSVVLNSSSCHPTKAIALARLGLPSSEVFKGGGGMGFNFSCYLPGPVVYRLRVVRDHSGTPASATFAVRIGKRGRPMAFVVWTPRRVAAYATSKCGG